jgi:hypothetical protein
MTPERRHLTFASGASDNSAMSAHLPRLWFSLDPLMAEAKRRMRKRRVLIAVLAVLICGGAASAGVVLISSSPVQSVPGACGAWTGYYAYAVPQDLRHPAAARERRYQLGVDTAEARAEGRGSVSLRPTWTPMAGEWDHGDAWRGVGVSALRDQRVAPRWPTCVRKHVDGLGRQTRSPTGQLRLHWAGRASSRPSGSPQAAMSL